MKIVDIDGVSSKWLIMKLKEKSYNEIFKKDVTCNNVKVSKDQGFTFSLEDTCLEKLKSSWIEKWNKNNIDTSNFN